MVKNPPASAGDMGLIPGSGRFPGEGYGNPSSILAWEIPCTEEPGGLQSMGLQKSQTQSSNLTTVKIKYAKYAHNIYFVKDEKSLHNFFFSISLPELSHSS